MLLSSHEGPHLSHKFLHVSLHRRLFFLHFLVFLVHVLKEFEHSPLHASRLGQGVDGGGDGNGGDTGGGDGDGGEGLGSAS